MATVRFNPSFDDKIKMVLARKATAGHKEAADRVLQMLKDFTRLWNRQPIYESTSVIAADGINMTTVITVTDIMVSATLSRWKAIDEGLDTAPNGISQIAQGKKYPMKFKLPYSAKSFDANGEGGGTGRDTTPPLLNFWEIAPGSRVIRPRAWTERVKAEASTFHSIMVEAANNA